MQINKLAENSAINVLSGVVSAVAAVLLPIILLRILGQETFSAWMLIVQIGSYIWYLNFGLQNAISRFVAIEAKNLDGDLDRYAVLASGIILLSLLGLIGLLAICVFGSELNIFSGISDQGLHEEAKNCLPWIAGCYAVMLPLIGVNGYFSGIKKNYQILINNSILKLGLILLTAFAAMVWHNLYAVTTAYVLAHVFATLHYIRVLKSERAADIRLILVGARLFIYELAKYAFKFIPWSISMIVVNAITLTMVAKYDYAAFACYSILTAMIGLGMGFHSAIYVNLLPEFAGAFSKSSKEDHGKVILETCRMSSFTALVLGMPFLIVNRGTAEMIVKGAMVPDGLTILFIIASASILRMMMAPYATHLLASYQSKLALVSATVEGACNLFVGLLLAPKYGAIGVAIGVIAGVVIGIACHYLSNFHRDRYMEANPIVFFRRVIVEPLSLMIPLFACILIQGNGMADIWLGLLGYTTSIILVYKFGLTEGQRRNAQSIVSILRARLK